MSRLRVAILVSPDVSDIYFANQLIKRVDSIVGVIVEKQHKDTTPVDRIIKTARYAITPWQLPKKFFNELTLKQYLQKAKKIDDIHFGKEGYTLFPGDQCSVIYTNGVKDINETTYVKEIEKLSPDLIAVCGSSILKKPILSIPTHGVLNLHGGLPQQYRGIWTTLWAIYNEEPEYIGATVHYVSEGIDDGNIIYQGRPTIVSSDNPETLYVKVVQLGIKMMAKAIEDIQNNTVKSYPLKEKGTLYLGKQVTPDIIRTAWKKTKRGVIHKYLKEKDRRDEKVTLVGTKGENSPHHR